MNPVQHFGFILIALAGTLICISADKHDENWNKCLGENIESAAMKKANETCVAELSLDKSSKHKLWENKCFKLCKLQKLGIIGADNVTLDTAKISEFIDATYPETARKGIKDGIGNCASITVGTMEKECKNYKELLECFHKAIRQNCKVTKDAAAINSPSGRPTTLIGTSQDLS